MQRIPILYPKRNHDGSNRIKIRAYLSNIHIDEKFAYVKRIERFSYEEDKQHIGLLQAITALSGTQEEYIFSPSLKHLGEEYKGFHNFYVIIWKGYDRREICHTHRLGGGFGDGNLMVDRSYIDIDEKTYNRIKREILGFCNPHMAFNLDWFVEFLNILGIDELDENLKKRWYKPIKKAKKRLEGKGRK